MKEITLREDKVFISLSYSPRAATLKRKFGNLPVRYMRAKIESNEDFKILEKVVKRYKYNLLDEEDEGRLVGATSQAAIGGVKRKLTVEEVWSSFSEDEKEDNIENGNGDVKEQPPQTSGYHKL